MFNETFPILITPDLQRALEFYRGLLDATVTYQFPPEGEPGYVSVEIGTSRMGIGQAPDGGDATGGPGRIALWVYADDCEAAVERLRGAGVRVTEEPALQPWGEKVAHVLDPDGNEVIVGERAPDEDRP